MTFFQKRHALQKILFLGLKKSRFFNNLLVIGLFQNLENRIRGEQWGEILYFSANIIAGLFVPYYEILHQKTH